MSSDEPALNVINQLLACRNYSHVARDVLVPVSRFVEATSAVALEFDATGEHLSIRHGIAYGVSDKSIDSYIQRYAAMDPLLLSVQQQHGLIARRQPIVTDLSYADPARPGLRDEYYQDFMRPHRLAHVLAVLVPLPEQYMKWIAIGLHRTERCAPFCAADRDRLLSVTPALGTLFAMMTASKSLQSCAGVLSALRRTLSPVGLLVIDDRFRVIDHVTQGLADCGASLDQCSAALHCLTQDRAAVGRLERGESVNLDLAGLAGISARVQKIKLADETGAYVIVTQPADDSSKFARRAGALGLTRRETEIASLIGQGLSNEAVAARLHISARTVDHHISSAYRKAGVHSRTQLLARLQHDG